jgi:hypothetical protein
MTQESATPVSPVAARKLGRLDLAADLLAAMPWWLRLLMPERVRRLLEEIPHQPDLDEEQ